MNQMDSFIDFVHLFIHPFKLGEVRVDPKPILRTPGGNNTYICLHLSQHVT